MMIKVTATRRFVKLLNQLSKKYPHISNDLQPFREQLLGGETPGDRLQGYAQRVYKVRVSNRDAQRGKSGGYRVIYYVKTAESIYLIHIYSKSELDAVADEIILSILQEISDEDDNNE